MTNEIMTIPYKQTNNFMKLTKVKTIIIYDNIIILTSYIYLFN